MPLSEKDLARMLNDAEAARALLHEDQQQAIYAKRVAALEALRGDPAAARQVVERWAALTPPKDER